MLSINQNFRDVLLSTYQLEEVTKCKNEIWSYSSCLGVNKKKKKLIFCFAFTYPSAWTKLLQCRYWNIKNKMVIFKGYECW